jgi:membrane fusion protein (multidrug efflux system)
VTEKKEGKKARTVILLGLAAAVILAAAVYAFMNRGFETTDDAQVEAHVAAVASRVAGLVTDLPSDNNQSVKAGDILARIDRRDYEIALDHARAALKAAEGQLSAATHGEATAEVFASTNVASAEKSVDSAKAQWERDASELIRLQSLTDAARSRAQLDVAVAAEKTSHAAYDRAQESLKFAHTAPDTVASVVGLVQGMEGAAGKARADVAQAEKNLADTEIKAPFDGTVAGKAVEKGGYAAPGQPLLMIVGNDVWVVANYKETQVGKMKPGQKAEIRFDAYPGIKLKGHVDSIGAGTGARFSLFPPENATGNFVKVVQRVPVKIVLDDKPDPALHLGPGMSVEPTVDTR